MNHDECPLLSMLLCVLLLSVVPIGEGGRLVVRQLRHHQRLVPFQEAYQTQRLLQEQQIALQGGGASQCGYLYSVQHPPVYTLGTGLRETDLPLRSEHLNEQLVFDTHRIDRAGEATFHGPGQLVFYPILDLHYFNRDIHWYLRSLETVIIDSLKEFNIQGGRIQGFTGVWVGNSKVAAMGIKLTRWVTLHGFSVNVHVDLRYFNQIIPCGISDRRVGNLVEWNSSLTLNEVAEVVERNFCRAFNVDLIPLN